MGECTSPERPPRRTLRSDGSSRSVPEPSSQRPSQPNLDTTLTLPLSASIRPIQSGWGRLSWFDTTQLPCHGDEAVPDPAGEAKTCNDSPSSSELGGSSLTSRFSDDGFRGSHTRRPSTKSLHRSLFTSRAHPISKELATTTADAASAANGGSSPVSRVGNPVVPLQKSNSNFELQSKVIFQAIHVRRECNKSFQDASPVVPPPLPLRNLVNLGFVLERPARAKNLKPDTQSQPCAGDPDITANKKEAEKCSEEPSSKDNVDQCDSLRSVPSDAHCDVPTPNVLNYPDTFPDKSKDNVIVPKRRFKNSSKEVHPITIPPRPPAGFPLLKRRPFRKSSTQAEVSASKDLRCFQQSQCLVSSSSGSELSICSSSNYGPVGGGEVPNIKTNGISHHQDAVGPVNHTKFDTKIKDCVGSAVDSTTGNYVSVETCNSLFSLSGSSQSKKSSVSFGASSVEQDVNQTKSVVSVRNSKHSSNQEVNFKDRIKNSIRNNFLKKRIIRSSSSGSATTSADAVNTTVAAKQEVSEVPPPVRNTASGPLDISQCAFTDFSDFGTKCISVNPCNPSSLGCSVSAVSPSSLTRNSTTSKVVLEPAFTSLGLESGSCTGQDTSAKTPATSCSNHSVDLGLTADQITSSVQNLPAGDGVSSGRGKPPESDQQSDEDDDPFITPESSLGSKASIFSDIADSLQRNSSEKHAAQVLNPPDTTQTSPEVLDSVKGPISTPVTTSPSASISGPPSSTSLPSSPPVSIPDSEAPSPGSPSSTMSHHSGSANYGTLRRGIKATTSRIIGASIRRPGLSPAISLDRSVGYGVPESSRFIDGVSFKGKLIGVLEVEAARGDRMCQEALAELKGAVRAAGEHKQRITVTVAMDGIRLRDDRTGDCLYHHPVHKISFIAQDMTDTRAFGYIFGSPDAGHKFFGIKTEKTASQVVIAMRDLFQVVFEMKKKEIEKARSQLEEGQDGADFKDSGLLSSLDGTGGFISASLTCGAGGAIADLLDLQSELSNLQRGLSQISSRHAASSSSSQMQKEEKPFDPFGDSFRPASVASSSASGSGGKAGLAVGGSATLPSSAASAAKARLPSTSSGGSAVSISNAPPPLAPPPLSGRSRHDSAHTRHHNVQQQSSQQHSMGSDSEHLAFATKFPVDFNNMTRPGAQSVPPHDVHEDRYAVFKEVRPASDESFNDFKGGGFGNSSRLAVSHEAVDSGHFRSGGEFGDEWSLNDLAGTSVTSESDVRTGSNYDVFTELDPLGTGKIRPFVDKKDFFNDVRKQTKRLLRELGDGEDSLPGSPRTQPAGVIPTEVSVLVASSSLYSSAGHPYTSTEAINSQQSASQNAPTSTTSTTPMHMSAIASHSFSESYSPPHDSYDEYRAHQSTTDQQLQQFETPVSGFADFNRFSGESPRSQRSEMSSSSMPEEPPPQLPVGALTVALPPESFRDSPPPQQQTPGQSPLPQKRLLKQMTVHAVGISPKTLPRSHKFGKQTSVEGDWDAPDQHEDHHERQFELPISLAEEDYGSGLACPVSSESISTGGVSPRPRPRSSLSKHLSVSSATLPLRQPHRFERKYSHDQNFEQLYDDDQKYVHEKEFNLKYNHDQFSSPEAECRPFPNDDLELTYDTAPAPPPRPAPIEPPPLPPKRQPTHVTLRPPPRPPTSSAEAHYFYINDKYDTPPEGTTATSPPIPLPSRKPRYSDISQPSSVPDRATKPSFVPEQPFHFPRPNISPTHDASSTGAIPKLALSSRDSTPSKTSTPSGKSPRTGKRPSTGSIDLTNTSLDQLAAKLEIPVEQLAKMTVVELAACLAQMQLKHEGSDSHHDADDTSDSCGSHTARSRSGEGRAPHPSYRERSQERCSSSRERMKFDEEEEFARFDAQFPVSPVNTPEFPLTLETTEQQSLGAPVSEDRYAVFRELTVTTKHKSVFDENFLTPQNSMEDEASEISSGTFKVNFVPPDFRQDSMDQKSSLSDDLDHERDHKHWNTAGLNEDEGVTVFRSPDISEYENFEPNFEAKFDEDFNTADKHSLDMVEVAALRSPASQKLSTDSGKSPFTDDFSCVSQEEIVRTLNATKSSSESLGKFEDDFIPPVESQEDKYAVFRELVLAETPQKAKSSTSSKSPFDNNFVENCPKEVNVLDSGFLSTAEDKFDDVFQKSEAAKDDVPEEPHSRKCSVNPDADSLNNAQEDNDSFNKSPFDDDFTNRSDRYEVLKEVESEREPSVEGEIGSQEGAGQAKSGSSPFDDSWHGSNRNISYAETKCAGESPQTVREEESHKPIPMSNNIYHEGAVSIDDRSRNCNANSRESPYEDCLSGSRDISLEMNNGFHRSASDRQKSGSGGIVVCNRMRSMSSDPERQSSRSPYSEGGIGSSHTPSYSDSIARRRCNSHGPSRLSVGSEGSGDARLSQQSPFDDNFNSVTGSVAEEVHFESAFPSLQPLPDNFTEDANSLNDPFANEKIEDAFVLESNSAFADFEQAFHQADKSSRGMDSVKETSRTPNPSFDVAEEAVFPDSNVEFRVSARFAQQTSQGAPSKDDDPDDIFRRNSDPFADDFFIEDLKDSGSSDNAQTEGGNATTWQEPFEVFNFSQNSTK